MTTKVVPGSLVALPDGEAVAREAANRLGNCIRNAIDTHGYATVALSGGSTPWPAYAALAENTRIDWGKVEFFFVDERAVAPDSPRSNYRMAKEMLFDRVPIPAERIHRMHGEALDLAAAAREYDLEIRSRLRWSESGMAEFDVGVFGIGDDGHTASLFPGEPTVDVTDRLCVEVPAAGKREARLTLTAPVIEQMRAALVLAVGKNKQEPLERVWAASGDVHVTPARYLREVRSVTWLIDKSAGGLG